MGYKTIKSEELEQRLTAYWIPSDYDGATVTDTVAGMQRRAKEDAGFAGFVRLTFDDETQVLTSVDYRFTSGAYQSIWSTGLAPADVVGAAQQGSAAGAALAPTFEQMWTTYQGWNEYLEYAAATYQVENPRFLAAVYEYDQNPSAEKFQEVWDTYLDDGAAQPVHIDNDILGIIRGRTPGDQYAFEEARSVIYQELNLNYAKFLTWYQQHRA